MRSSVVWLLALLAAAHSSLTSAETARPVINVILMGGTGNLAQKYLWQGECGSRAVHMSLA
jgi:hypothetical protein